MATKSFINKYDVGEFEAHFNESLELMHAEGKNWFWLVQKLSFHLENYLVNQLQKLPGRDDVGVISLGSWSRSELCPRSDIDVILLGKDESIESFVRSAEEKGIFLKYRTPEDLKDWAVGVNHFDLLALTGARAVDSTVKTDLKKQKNKLLEKMNNENLASVWVGAMHEERVSRNDRYDSLANYLQPNLKYGPGGLRDAEQTAVAIRLYPTVFSESQKDISLFENDKAFLLVVRYLLHLKGASDLLDAQVSSQVSKALKFSSLKEFNSQVQIKLYEINFFTQLVHEMILADERQLVDHDLNLQACVKELVKDSTILRQNYTRNQIKRLNVNSGDKEFFAEYFESVKSEQTMLALYQSEILFKFFPHLKRCHGQVQYDHYHRYTVDAHTVQALRVFCQCLSSAEEVLLNNSVWFEDLSQEELKILLWSLLYHDMAKGLKGSHSELGAQLVVEELGEFGLSASVITEVSWLVKNHLILSEAAFRKNPEDLSTWEWIHGHGSTESRIRLLACLTAIDIVATNPDAWTPWKSNLLFRLVEHILSPEALHFLDLSKLIGSQSTEKMRGEYLSRLSPMLMGQINSSILAHEFVALTDDVKKSLSVLFVEGEDGYKWVRFHSRKDSSGLFLDWCKTLTALSCSVREAYIHTYNSFGAYDWIKIKSNRSIEVLTKQMKLIDLNSVKVNRVNFESIKVIDKPHKDEWIVKFKGTDQDGALLSAVSTIYNHGLEIIWARVHTWGDILEDVFALKGDEANLDKLLEK